MAQILLNAGANIHQMSSDEFGTFPLLYAVQRGYYDMCQFLLAHGAQIDMKNRENGATPLLFAV